MEPDDGRFERPILRVPGADGDALEIDRRVVDVDAADLEASAKTVRSVYRPHPAVLLVQLGRLDFANGDLTHASEKYAEAISIGDEYPRLEKP